MMRTYVRVGLLAVVLALVVLAGRGMSSYAWTGPAALNTNAATDTGDDENPQITTDGAGNWVAVWHSYDDLGATIGTDADILVSRSVDSGATWTPPVALNTNAATDSRDDWYPQVTTDGAGNWVAVWESWDDLGGTIWTDADILVSRSTNNGATWTAPAALNANAATDTGDDWVPQVTTDGAGNWVAVWHSYESLGGTIGTDGDILVSRSTDSGTTWTAPAALNTNAATDSGWDTCPEVTTDGGGNWVAAWQSTDDLGGTIGTDYDILVARSANNGATWTAPAALNSNAGTDSGNDNLPQVTTDGGGNWVAVWESSDDLGGTIGTDGDILVSRSTNNGATWTPLAVLNAHAATDLAGDTLSQVTTDGVGTWVAVWHCNDDLGGTIGSDGDILESRSTDNGATWTPATTLNTNAATDSGTDTSPQVTTDGAGNWVAAWFSVDDLGGTIGTDRDILVSRERTGAWTGPAVLNTNAATDQGNDWSPQVTTDGGGNWVAVWQSNDDLLFTIGTDWDILVARSTDNGATWTAPIALNSNAATDSGDDRFPQVTTNGAGNWVAVWQSSDDLGATIGMDEDILVSRSTDNGVTWTPPAPLNTNATTDSGGDWAPQVTTNGAGNWVAVWVSDDDLGATVGTDDDILVSRSTDNGVTWTAPAALNSNAATDSGDDRYPQVTTDGLGNWVAAWQSTDDLGATIGTDYDILVSRAATGIWTWTSPIALNSNAATDSGADWKPQVTTDGAGNWVAAWNSDDDLGATVGTDDDILVARSADNGTTWTPPVALNTNAATDSGNDRNPQVTTDGGGNWVAVWESLDDLGGTIGTDRDILESRSTDSGATWTPPVALDTNAATDSGDDAAPQVTTDGGGNWVAVWDSDENLGGTIGIDYDILYVTEVIALTADLEKLDLFVKPFYCGDSDMDGDEATGTWVDAGTGTCCDGVDNDADTVADGRDPECWPFTNEDAADGVDNDGDGYVDEDPLTYGSGQTCPWNGDDDCDLVVDEDPKNNIDDDGDTRIDEDPANGFLGIDNDGNGWVDEDGAGRFDWNGDTAIDDLWQDVSGYQDAGTDDDADTRIDDDSLDSPVTDRDPTPGAPQLVYEPHYLVKELLRNNGPGPIVLAEDIKEIDAPGAKSLPRFSAPGTYYGTREDGLETCEDGQDNDGDTLIDAADPQCLEVHVWEEAPGLHACNDGLDNGDDTLIDEEDEDCETLTEVSVECETPDDVIVVKEAVDWYVKLASDDIRLLDYEQCSQYYDPDPAHWAKCVPCKIYYGEGPLEAACGAGSQGQCAAVDSKPGVEKELALKEQVELPIGVVVTNEHQFDLSCEDETSNHLFTIQNEIQPPAPVVDPNPGNNALEMEMLVGCVAFADGEVRDLVVPASPWNVDVSTSDRRTVSVDVYNHGPVARAFTVQLLEESPGLGLVDEGGEMADTDDDGWADNVEATLGSNPNDGGSTPESIYAWGTCSDGVDNDGHPFPGIDLADPKCRDTDQDGHSDLSEIILNSDLAESGSRPEHMQLPWTCGDGLDNDEDGMEDGSGPVAPGDGDCNDGADNDLDTFFDGDDPDCLPFIDTNEPDDDSNGYGDCTIDQLEGVRPPVTCASGWVREGNEKDYVTVAGDGTLRVGMNVGSGSVTGGGSAPVSRDLVFHCFAPASPYPTEVISARLWPTGGAGHIFDLNADNDGPIEDTFSGNATCALGEADLELIDWTFTPDVPGGFVVSQDHVYATTKTIHNHGPTAADVRVQKAMNVPVNCDGSLHASYAGETVYVAQNTMYKMPPDVPDWTDSGWDGEVLNPAVSQIVYVQGSTSLELEESELSAEFILAAVAVPVSVPVAVEEDFDIHCRQTGVQGVDDDSDTVIDEDPPDGADDDGDTQVDEDPAGYSFEFGNQIVLADYPTVCDPTLGDLAKDVTKVVDVLPGGSDKMVLDIDFDDGSAYPVLGTSLPADPSFGNAQTFSIKVSDNEPFSVTSWDVNNGPSEPLDAEISFYVDVPAGCDGRWYDPSLVFPFDIPTLGGDENIPSDGIPYWPPAKEPGPVRLDLHFQTLEYGITEPVGIPVDFTRFFEIHCHAEGMYQFQFCNRADVKPPDTDPDPGNNLMCEPLWVLTPNAPGCPNTDGPSGYDTWTSCQEQHMGTDYNDDCPDMVGHDALPPDFSMDKTVNILDVLMFKPKLPPNPHDKRYDLNTDFVVNILDVLLFKVELVKPWPCS